MSTVQERADYIRRQLSNAGGDDLERAECAFRGMSEKELDQQYGQSGNTCREILDGYRKKRQLHKESMDYLEGLLGHST